MIKTGIKLIIGSRKSEESFTRSGIICRSSLPQLRSSSSRRRRTGRVLELSLHGSVLKSPGWDSTAIY